MKPTRWLALLLSFCATLPTQRTAAMEIIAHRGASNEAPENTLAAMKLAWEQNADAVELDIWLSKDGRILVFHDADTKRFERPARKITDLTFGEAQQIDVGGWKAAAYKGEKMPTLDSILASVPKGKHAVIEIKCGPEVLPELRRVIDQSGRLPEQLRIISFSHDTLKASKEMFPQIEHYWLANRDKDPATGKVPDLPSLIARANAAKFDGLNLKYTWPIDADFVKQVKDAGLKLLVWTVDDFGTARKLREAGVNAITTNKPKLQREALGVR